MEPVLTRAVQLLSYCCNLRQTPGNSISSPCTKTTLERLITACLKHDNYAVSTPAHPFLSLIVSFTPHTPTPSLFSPDNPRLCLTPSYISHCHTLHHFKRLYLLPPLLPLLSGAVQTRHWICDTMPAVFTSLSTCLHTALTTFSQTARHKRGKNLNSFHSQRSLCSSLHCACLSVSG